MTRNRRLARLVRVGYVTPMGAHLAYIDGGTGSMALQLLLAGLLGGLYAVQIKWAALKKFLRERASRKT
jgi:hypothetical protein